MESEGMSRSRYRITAETSRSYDGNRLRLGIGARLTRSGGPGGWEARRAGEEGDPVQVRKPSGRTAAEPLLDDINKAIIEQLQEDGRRSYAAMAQAVGLSEAAVRQRVQRLLDAGIMQIVAVTDPLRVGFKRQAMIGVRVSGDTREVAEALAQLPEVDYVVISAGSFDLLLELVAEDDEHLISLVNDHIRALPQVRETETFVYLRLVKQTYTWGVR
jgi:Lrp/AsnC family transcriptional regulator for asnA, asnC and gidA